MMGVVSLTCSKSRLWDLETKSEAKNETKQRSLKVGKERRRRRRRRRRRVIALALVLLGGGVVHFEETRRDLIYSDKESIWELIRIKKINKL